MKLKWKHTYKDKQVNQGHHQLDKSEETHFNLQQQREIKSQSERFTSHCLFYHFRGGITEGRVKGKKLFVDHRIYITFEYFITKLKRLHVILILKRKLT